jgi:hypothetical protein
MLQFNLERSANEARTWLNAALPKAIPLRWPGCYDIAVRSVVAGVPEALGDSALGSMSVFLSAGNQSLIVKATSWQSVSEGSGTYYVFRLDLDNDVLSPLFMADDAPQVMSAVGEIRILPGDGTREFIVNDIPFEIRKARMAGEIRIPLASSATKQSGMIRLGNDVGAGVVAFNPEMIGVPVVSLQVLVPAGQTMIFANPVDEVTAEGFAFELSDHTASDDCWVYWAAEILTDADGATIPGIATRNLQITDLVQGEQIVEIDFDPALTGTPFIRSLAVIAPEGAVSLFPSPVSITAEKLTLRLSDAPAAANYKLHSNVEVI